MEYNRAGIKREVKQIMKQTRPRPMWMTLLYMIVVAAGAWVIRTAVGGVMGVGALAGGLTAFPETLDIYDMEQLAETVTTYLLRNMSVLSGLITGSVVIGVLNYLWQSLMSVSYVGYSLAMVRGGNPDAKTLFSAFPKFGRVILTRILVGVFTVLWSLLFVLGFVVVAVVVSLLVDSALAVLLLVVAYALMLWGILWATLRYAMTDYLVVDHGLVGLEAIRTSRDLMKGNKGKFFMLQLSFIGWVLLEIVIVYIGVFVAVLAAIPALAVGEGALGGIVVGVIAVLVSTLVVSVAILLLNMWLTPYVAGASAKFYEYTLSRRPDLFPRQPKPLNDDSFGNPDYPKLD